MGINTIKIVTEDGSAEGLGFAIPSARIKYVADRLIAGEEVQTGVFGFTVNTVPVEGGGLELIDVEEDSGEDHAAASAATLAGEGLDGDGGGEGPLIDSGRWRWTASRWR